MKISSSKNPVDMLIKGVTCDILKLCLIIFNWFSSLKIGRLNYKDDWVSFDEEVFQY